MSPSRSAMSSSVSRKSAATSPSRSRSATLAAVGGRAGGGGLVVAGPSSSDVRRRGASSASGLGASSAVAWPRPSRLSASVVGGLGGAGRRLRGSALSRPRLRGGLARRPRLVSSTTVSLLLGHGRSLSVVGLGLGVAARGERRGAGFLAWRPAPFASSCSAEGCWRWPVGLRRVLRRHAARPCPGP